jgi:hypothetical protein
MLPSYVLTVDIKVDSRLISFELFRERVSQSLVSLEVLKGAFDRSPCTIAYYPHDVQQSKHEHSEWSARGVVMISVGIQRGEYLVGLYESIARLIEFELPDFEVKSETSKFSFS